MAGNESRRSAAAETENVLLELRELVNAFRDLGDRGDQGVPAWLSTLERHVDRLEPAVERLVAMTYRSGGTIVVVAANAAVAERGQPSA